MDDKTIEALFNQIKTEQTPDVWDKIESALPDRESLQDISDNPEFDALLPDAGEASVEASASKIKKSSRKNIKKYIGIGAAVAACLLVLAVPVRLLFFGYMGRSSDSAATVTEAYDAEPQEYASADNGSTTSGSTVSGGGYNMSDGKAYDAAAYEEAGEAEYDVTADVTANGTAETGQVDDAAVGRKLIRRVTMEVETLEFDSMVSSLKETVARYGGYFELSDISGNRASEYSRMYGSFVVRIPSASLDAFLDEAGGLGNVIYESESSEDVTLQYVDTEAHIEALRVQQEKLMGFLEKAETMEEILQIEDSLTDVRYELEYYESMKKQYDNQVNYSTVTMNIQEVKEETPIKELTFVERLKDGLEDTLTDIAIGGRDFVIWFVSSLPYFVIIGVVAVAAIVVIKKVMRKHKKY